MRLTVKNGEGLITAPESDYSLQNNVCYNDCVQKLGRLEDIEKELGIDFITLFKALKQGGVYVKEGNKVDWCLMMKGFEIVGDGNEISLWSQVKLDPKDYGKSWALTKGELE